MSQSAPIRPYFALSINSSLLLCLLSQTSLVELQLVSDELLQHLSLLAPLQHLDDNEEDSLDIDEEEEQVAEEDANKHQIYEEEFVGVLFIY